MLDPCLDVLWLAGKSSLPSTRPPYRRDRFHLHGVVRAMGLVHCPARAVNLIHVSYFPLSHVPTLLFAVISSSLSPLQAYSKSITIYFFFIWPSFASSVPILIFLILLSGWYVVLGLARSYSPKTPWCIPLAICDFGPLLINNSLNNLWNPGTTYGHYLQLLPASHILPLRSGNFSCPHK